MAQNTIILHSVRVCVSACVEVFAGPPAAAHGAQTLRTSSSDPLPKAPEGLHTHMTYEQPGVRDTGTRGTKQRHRASRTHTHTHTRRTTNRVFQVRLGAAEPQPSSRSPSRLLTLPFVRRPSSSLPSRGQNSWDGRTWGQEGEGEGVGRKGFIKKARARSSHLDGR